MAAIGWRKDKEVFGDVVGLSLLALGVSPQAQEARPQGWRLSQPSLALAVFCSVLQEWMQHNIPAVDQVFTGSPTISNLAVPREQVMPLAWHEG